MIKVMKTLEPRRYNEKTIIYEELQEILEITFVLSGTYFIGYEINKVKKMKLHRPPNTVFGGFELFFGKKSMFIYKCNYEINGFAIRRDNWLALQEEDVFMTFDLKRNIFNDYVEEIRKPLLEHKMKDFAILENRADMNSIVAITDDREIEFLQIKEELQECDDGDLIDEKSLE